MTKNAFGEIYHQVTGTFHFRGIFWKTFRDEIRELPTIGCLRDFIAEKVTMSGFQDKVITKKDFIKACDALVSANVPGPYTAYYALCQGQSISLGDCKPASTGWTNQYYTDDPSPIQQQGNNPMAYDTNVASAAIITAKSDESIQRDYLLKEFDNSFGRCHSSVSDKISSSLRKQFNLDAPKIPQSSAEIIAAFQTGAFTVDQAKVDANAKLYSGEYDGPSYDKNDEYIGVRYYGITFTGLPVADMKGWEAAKAAFETAKINAKRKIIVASPADGLQALVDLENWTPPAGTVAS